MSSNSYLDGDGTTDPYCKLDELYSNSEGLVVLSGGVNDLFGQLFKLNKLDLIKDIFNKIIKKFHNNFYIEIQRHFEIDEKNFEQFLMETSVKINLPLLRPRKYFTLMKIWQRPMTR